MDKDQVVEILSQLIAVCHHGEKGFRTAADGIKHIELKRLFLSIANERLTFAQELQRIARKEGRSPDTSGTIGGRLRQSWIDIASLVTQGDERAIVAEAERGEDVALNAYTQALERGLPEDLHTIVSDQLDRVRASHDRMRELERAYARA